MRYFPKAKATLSDVSAEALKFSKKNLERYQLQNRAEVIQSNLFDGLSSHKWDYILSNPPYLSAADWSEVEPEILTEPREALDGGADGLSFYRSIITQAKQFLNQRGCLALEIGYGQADAVMMLCQENGFLNINCFQDHAGKDRVILAKAD